MNNQNLSPFGRIELICGPMFSGKTEELIRRTRRAEYAHLRTQVFKSALDVRFGSSDVISHDRSTMPGESLERVEAIEKALLPETQVVVIDEIQFFDASVVTLCEKLADKGLRVIVAGLDMDYLGRPFDSVAQLLARAESVTKLSAICVRCGQDATRSHRVVAQIGQILVGALHEYEALCRRCYNERK